MSAGASERRGAERHVHAERVALVTEWGDLDGTLVDLSLTGGQMRVVNGLVPIEGDEVALKLVDGRHIAGSVSWVGAANIGVEFDQPLPCIEDVLWLEQRDAEWFYKAAHARHS